MELHGNIYIYIYIYVLLKHEEHDNRKPVSAIKHSPEERLFSSFSSTYEECLLLGCGAV
jgi:hypothetical protein